MKIHVHGKRKRQESQNTYKAPNEEDDKMKRVNLEYFFIEPQKGHFFSDIYQNGNQKKKKNKIKKIKKKNRTENKTTNIAFIIN